MFTKFKRETKRVFLDPVNREIEEYDQSQKLSIILSPSLYWVKKMKLPVKSVREAKSLLPSIFEEILLEGDYSYSAYKSGEEFYLFAYEDKKILELLQVKGVALADVEGVYFAQSIFCELEGTVGINETQALQVKDSLVVLLPRTWAKELQVLDLESLKLSTHTIKLQQFGHIVNRGATYKIATVLVVLIAIISIEVYITAVKKDEIVFAKEELFSEYKLQATMMQNRSTLDKYMKIHKKQKGLRESVGAFLSLSLKKEEKIELVEYKNSSLSVLLSGVTKLRELEIAKILKEKGINFKETLQGSDMRVEMSL
ncbi:MAG: hypothetical protein JXQ67_00515 [Campylobacterales bacterium]|nr:hypothetical protein [Campylobacterales bacterium]